MAKTATLAAPTFKGTNATARASAFEQIAPLSFAEGMSREETIANLRVVLGPKPTPRTLEAARLQWIVGRVAARLAKTDLLPNTKNDKDGRLAFADMLVNRYGDPVKDGVTPRKLRKGLVGRRSPAQHRVVRAAIEAWSQVKAELGFGAAQTQKQRNAAKRKPRQATKATPPTHAQLVKAPTPASANDVCGYLESMAATMLAYINKNAGRTELDYANAVRQFKRNIDAAAKARRDK